LMLPGITLQRITATGQSVVASKFVSPVGRNLDLVEPLSPLQRILRLEAELDRLQRHLAMPPPQAEDTAEAPPRRSIWPASEWSLTQQIRRSPELLTAYRSGADLTRSPQGDLRLTPAPGSSPYHFCELGNGDATVWLAPAPPDWIWRTEVFQSLFTIHEDGGARANLVLQRLPVFKAVVRGRVWSLFMAGELVPRSRRFQSENQQLELLSRLDRLERELRANRARQDTELATYRQTIDNQKELIDRLILLLDTKS
jgi:hypothetical protein